jgi:hypothetical protein
MNFKYAEALIAADQFQLYKLLWPARSRATLDMTASFLPKPVTGINGNGAHTNMSVSKKGKTNLFHDKKGKDGLSKLAWEFIDAHPGRGSRHLPRAQLRRSTPTAASTRTTRRPTRSRSRRSTAAR